MKNNASKSVLESSHELSQLSADDVNKLVNKTKREYGFAKEEIRFISRHKPSFLMWENLHEHTKTGMPALQKFFIEKHGFSKELLRTLVVKFPVILSKDVDHIQGVFDLLEKHCGLTPEQSIKLIFECPKLLSVKLDERMEKILYFFELYHGFEKTQVINEIFMHFPYLFCCDPVKISQFLAHFRKYKLSQSQIINLVSNKFSSANISLP